MMRQRRLVRARGRGCRRGHSGGREVGKLIDSYVKAYETAELAERLERLERMTKQ